MYKIPWVETIFPRETSQGSKEKALQEVFEKSDKQAFSKVAKLKIGNSPKPSSIGLEGRPLKEALKNFLRR